MKMQKDLTYVSPEGNTIFTSQFLKNRGTCCKSACLHCPYGFTLKRLGLEFASVQESDFPLVENIMAESGSAIVEWQGFYPDNIKMIKIKNVVCGILLKNHIVIKHLYLRPYFQNQNLSKEMVESYLFC